MEAHDGHDVKSSPLLPLPVSSRSLGGSGGSWWTQRWCKLIGIIPQKLLWNLHQEPCQDSTFPTCLFLESSWQKSSWWTWRLGHMNGNILMKLLWNLSRSNIMNPIKNPPLLHVSQRSLKGHGGSWITWRCVQMNWSQMDPEMVSDEWKMLLWKFNQEPTSGTLSRIYLSSKSLPGVLEDM